VVPFTVLKPGSDGNAIVPADYIGDGAAPLNERTGLAGLEVIDEISLLCVPDDVNFPDLQSNLVVQCEQLKDRFAILQIARGQSNRTDVNPPFPSSYAAI